MSFIPWWTMYPYVNDEAINLDWLLNKVTKDGEKIENFINLNSIKYANPILWNITSQYEANTIVIDPQTGDAYLSVDAVPYGTHLDNTTYWTKIYNYQNAINTLQEQIAIANERLSTTASEARSIGDLVWLNGELYEVIAAMIAGDSYVENSNCIKTTIEEYINTNDTAMRQNISINAAAIGTLSALNTTDKDSLVDAINEVDANSNSNAATIGNLSDLNTTDKDSLVDAINEVDANSDSNAATINLLTNKRFIVLGDSFLAGTNVDGPDPLTSWGALVKSWLGLSDGNMILLPLGGAGFVSQGINYTFINLLQNATISSPDTITDIVVTGGTNDANNATTAQVENAIASFCAYCKTNFPNAKIHIGYLGGIRAAGWQKNVDSHNMVTCYKRCAKYGASFIENVQYTIRRLTYLQTDKVHPNQTGQNYIAECFANWFLNGDYEVISSDIGYVGSLGTDVSSGLVTIRQSQHNSQINLEILATQPVASSKGSTTLNGTNAYEISDISDDGFILGYDISAGFSTAACDVVFNFHDGTRWRNGQGTLQVRAGKLLLYPSVMDETNNNWFTVTIGSIWLSKASNITFDALNV